MNRIHAIDYLKLLIAFSVVWAHAVLLSGHFTVANYVVGQGLVRNAVPAFALISGFLFHSTLRKGNTRRWLSVLFAAYVFWYVAYMPIWLPPDVSLSELVWRFLIGPLHLWYMAALILAVAMITAIVGLSPSQRAAERILLWGGIVALMIGSAIQAVDFFTPIDISLNAYRNGVFLEFPYAAFGYLLAARIRHEGLDSLPSGKVLWSAFAALVVLRLGEAIVSLRLFGLSPVAPPEIAPLAVAFCLVLMMAMMRTRFSAPPLKLGLLSMFIYFLHYGVLIGLLSLGLTNMWLMVVAGIVLPSLFAMALVCALQKLYPALTLSSTR